MEQQADYRLPQRPGTAKQGETLLNSPEQIIQDSKLVQTESYTGFRKTEFEPLRAELLKAIEPVLEGHIRIEKLGGQIKGEFIHYLADKLTGEFFAKSYDYEKKQIKQDEVEQAQRQAKFRIEQIQAMRSISVDDFRKRVLKSADELVQERNPDRFFVLDKYSERSFDIFLNYFHPALSGYSLNKKKGICLLGPVGTGKSTLLTAFKDNPFASFRIVKAQEIVESYMNNPEQIINRILTPEPLEDKPNEYGFTRYEILIEEVGREQLSVIPKGDSYKNTPVNVLERVFMELYDYQDVRVHMISNAEIKGTETHQDKLTKLYGEAAASRIYDMFNVITQDPNAPNRRL